MATVTAVTTKSTMLGERKRRLGHVAGALPGPMLVCVGGIHGNEPAGVQAINEVLEELASRAPTCRGDFVGLAGNLQALGRNRRFLDRDLNRSWLTERIEYLRGRGVREPSAREDLEQWELLTSMEDLLKHRRGPAIFLDLHTTSADGEPFAIIEDTIPNRRLGFQLPLPVILGLEEKVEGTFIDYVNGRGHMGISIEGGRHDATSSVAHHKAALWTVLVAAGIISPADVVPDLAAHRRLLADVSRGVPRVLEVRYRHGITDGDGFRMERGFANFSRVSQDQLLARDRHGEIRARERGRLLLPLYQDQGSDGFFVVRRVRPFWLWVARQVRFLGLDRFVHLLPGVERQAGRRDTLVVDRRVARWYVVEIFHLLGYRRERQLGNKLVVQRRPYDDQQLSRFPRWHWWRR